jgi:hypothetical protein
LKTTRKEINKNCLSPVNWEAEGGKMLPQKEAKASTYVGLFWPPLEAALPMFWVVVLC